MDGTRKLGALDSDLDILFDLGAQPAIKVNVKFGYGRKIHQRNAVEFPAWDWLRSQIPLQQLRTRCLNRLRSNKFTRKTVGFEDERIANLELLSIPWRVHDYCPGRHQSEWALGWMSVRRLQSRQRTFADDIALELGLVQFPAKR
jgi:hypothetical protein